MRPRTVVELAAEHGYQGLPTTDVDALSGWFYDAANSGSLERYLETFAHTVGVMQTPEALARVAVGVRPGPRRRRRGLRRGPLRPRAARGRGHGAAGGRRGGQRRVPRGASGCAAAAGTPIRVGALLTAMRHAARSMEIAELAVRYRDDGVVGLRHRRCRGRLPADPAPGRVRVPPARERPLHDPRGRGLRAALDLAGDPVVRRRPAGPRRPDHRRHHRRRRRRGHRSACSRPTCGTSGSRWRWRRRRTS